MSDDREREPRIFFPFKQGSRTPEQFRAAVMGVIEKRRAREAAESSGSEARSEASPRASQRKILTPAVLSKHHEAIKEAVEKVVAARERQQDQRPLRLKGSKNKSPKGDI
jgi:hypothetical protein